MGDNQEISKGGSTVLLTTQYLQEADELADRVAVIDHGKVVAEGTVNELKGSIGTSSLHLSIQNEQNMQEARLIVERVLNVQSAVSAEGGKITAPMADADKVTDLLMTLKTAGIPLAELSVQKPTLDEVFLAITGSNANVDKSSKGEGLV